MHLTTKQIELLRVISAGNGPGLPADLDEILDRVRYETSKQSLQFSIRALIGHGLIFKKGFEKRRGRQRQVIEATEQGHASVRTGSAPEQKTAPAPVIEIDDDGLSEIIETLE